MPRRPRNWADAAGADPTTGERLRVCDLVQAGEEVLGVRHRASQALAVLVERVDR